jgi:hypothetical protein
MEYVRTFTRDFELGDSAELDVDVRSGSLSVRGDDTTSRARVEVVARLWADDEREADEQADIIARGITAQGKRLSIRTPAFLRSRPFLVFSVGPRVDYQVVLPHKTRASIAARSGRVEVEHIAGPLEITARSGRVTVNDVHAGTRVVSRSGSVHATSIGGALDIESRSGGVRVRECRGKLTVQSRSGSLQVEDVAGDIEVQGRSGSIAVADAGAGLSIATRTGAVRYEGPVRGSFNISVSAGAVRLSLDPDSVFFLDAESAHGAVRSDFQLRRNSGSPSGAKGEAPTVRVRTRAGAIHITPR